MSYRERGASTHYACRPQTAITRPGITFVLCTAGFAISADYNVRKNSQSQTLHRACTFLLQTAKAERSSQLKPTHRALHSGPQLCSMPSPLHLTFQALFSTIGAYLALLFRATARVLFEREPVESEGEPEALDLGILRLDQAIHQADFELARARAEAENR